MGSVQFPMIPCFSLYFSSSVGPFQCSRCSLQGFNLWHLSLPEQLPSVYFGFSCLHVSSVSNFCPDTRGQRWSLPQAHLFSCVVGRKEPCKQIPLACVGSALSVSAALGLPPLGVCAFPVYTAQVPGCSAGKVSKAGSGLRALPRSKPLRFLGTLQGHILS